MCIVHISGLWPLYMTIVVGPLKSNSNRKKLYKACEARYVVASSIRGEGMLAPVGRLHNIFFSRGKVLDSALRALYSDLLSY